MTKSVVDMIPYKGGRYYTHQSFILNGGPHGPWDETSTRSFITFVSLLLLPFGPPPRVVPLPGLRCDSSVTFRVSHPDRSFGTSYTVDGNIQVVRRTPVSPVGVFVSLQTPLLKIPLI